jgi:hypothetical protein
MGQEKLTVQGATMKRKYLYIAGAAVVVIALAVGGIVALNKDDNKSTADQASSAVKDDQVQPIKSDDIETPTNNDELANTLNEDAASFDTDLKNYENSDYNDSNLTDDSLYN